MAEELASETIAAQATALSREEARGVMLAAQSLLDPPQPRPGSRGRAGDGRAARRGADRHYQRGAALAISGALEPPRRLRRGRLRRAALSPPRYLRVLGARRLDPADVRLPLLPGRHAGGRRHLYIRRSPLGGPASSRWWRRRWRRSATVGHWPPPISSALTTGAAPRRWDWHGLKESRRALGALWTLGDLMVHSRRGGQKVYDLREHVLADDYRRGATRQRQRPFAGGARTLSGAAHIAGARRLEPSWLRNYFSMAWPKGALRAVAGARAREPCSTSW